MIFTISVIFCYASTPSALILVQRTRCHQLGRLPSPLGCEPRLAASQSLETEKPREKRSVRGEPAGYELGEKSHAIRFA